MLRREVLPPRLAPHDTPAQLRALQQLRDRPQIRVPAALLVLCLSLALHYMMALLVRNP